MTTKYQKHDLPITELDTPCVEWQGKTTAHGYVEIRRDGRRWRLHRWVWTQANGPIPDGLFVMHLCDNRKCYRLDHLTLGTHADNMTDIATKGRHWRRQQTHCPKGHEWTDATTKWYRNMRYCRTCEGLRENGWARNRRKTAAQVVAAVALTVGPTAVACNYAGVAHASEVPGLVNCGGNQGTQNPTVPWDCGNSKTIAGIVGGPVVGRLHVANGQGSAAVTVTVTLPAPQTFDVSLSGFWHIGISSGPLTATSTGVIPAGSLEATVVTNRTGTCDGQFDFQVNKPPTVGRSDLYRLHGPWLTVPQCIDTQTVATTSPPASSLPPVTTGTPGGSVPATPRTPSAPQLPATGLNWDIAGAIFIALIPLTLGLALLLGAWFKRGGVR